MDHRNRPESGALAGALADTRDRVRARNVTAVLGPTNTGKTHYAIERMLAHPSGIMGLPLRLLAREVYGRVVERVGADQVALITGEEKIKPKAARYWICTVEAMPRDLECSFVALDEVQLCADLDRGHVFTDRLLHRRGYAETLVIGAGTMRRIIEKLLPGVAVVERPRLSKLTFAGEKKLSRLPHRSAIVAFSAEEVYAIAELIRRQRGGAAVVLGALSPRTRNAQVAMYQNGDVDYLVATDAIGMGLNLDVDHVAFAGERKFDGWQYRRLNAAEFGQIAGRAGRHVKDGTFGTTGRCPPFEEDLVEALENHRFDAIGILQWRNFDLDFASIENLQRSLDLLPTEAGLTRAPVAADVLVLEVAARDESVRRNTKTRADVARLWDVCQVPDYRKVSPAAHAELALALFNFVVRAGRVPDLWFGPQVALCDRTEGDIDTLSNRIAQVRTLTYIANRPDWLSDPEHWQGVTRQLEDRLSDALHDRLAQRFVDRRTSVLMRRLRENAMLDAEITAGGDVLVEGQHMGQLHGFRFTPDPQAAGEAARALNAAALKALAGEIEARAERFSASVDEGIALANDGTLRWLGDPVAKLVAGDKLLGPRVRVLADEHLTGPALETVQRRLDLWVAQHIKKHLGALAELETGEGLDGIARGIAFQVAEALGVLERSRVADEMKALDQTARGTLRKLGFRFGAYHIYLPALVKPAPRALAAQLWALHHGGAETAKGLDEVPHLASSGRTSFVADLAVPKGLYRAAGFRVCGNRAVRVDILERLADLIRPAIAYRPGTTPGTPPPGTADGDGFVTTVQMTSLAGCSGEDFASILKALGYVLDRRAGPPITVPLVPAAPTEPLKPRLPEAAPVAATEDSSAEPEDAALSPDGTPKSPDGTVSPEAAAVAGQTVAADERPAEIPADEGLIVDGTGTVLPEPAPRESTHAEAAIEDPETPTPVDEFAELAIAEAEPTIADEHAVETPVEAPVAAASEAPAEAGAVDVETAAEEVHEPSPLEPTPAEVAADRSVASGAAVVEAAIEEPETPTPVDVIAELAIAEAKPTSAEEHAVETPVETPVAEASEASAETGAVDIETAAEELPGPVEPAEPVLIEVWRPHRFNPHAQRRPDRNRPRDARRGPTAVQGAGPATAEAETSGDRPPADGPPRAHAPGERRDDRRPRGARLGGRGPSGAEQRTGDTGAPRGGKPRFEGRREEGRGEDHRRDAPRRDDRREGVRPDGGRPPQGGERAPRDRQPDPNSPFAKLMALKLELERGKKDG